MGVLCTAASYGAFVGLSSVVHPQIANVMTWVLGLGLGFALNRRITYRISGPEGRGEQFARFVLGSFGQLLVSAFGFWVLMSVLKLPAWLAFPICLAFTSAYMFAYLESIAFRDVKLERR